MKPGQMRLRRPILAGALLAGGASALLAGGMPPVPACLGAQAADLQRLRSIAESQHEIVMILIRKQEFAKAAAEAGKIFELKWPDDQEPTLRKELLDLADQFLHAGQTETALLLLETNLVRFKTARSQADIRKEMGYLNDKLGRPDKALECFREAQRLEKIAKTP
jgi:tetratricopeptide (TPR) repeat protein